MSEETPTPTEPASESEDAPAEATGSTVAAESADSAASAEDQYSFFQMFFVPMLIASVLTGVILFFGLIGRDDRAISDYLNEIKMGSQHQRWQSAYELAYKLQSSEERAITDQDRRLALEVFDSAPPEDTKIREYLALTLGQMKVREAVPSLVDALEDQSDKTRIYALMSLGAIGDPSSEAAVAARLDDPDAGIRKTAAFALGGIGGELAREGLHRTIHDPVADVRWNSALSLARLGDDAGRDELLKMADRELVSSTPGITEAQAADVLEGAAKALGALKVEESIPLLQVLARQDPDHEVRQAAHTSLEILEATP